MSAAQRRVGARPAAAVVREAPFVSAHVRYREPVSFVRGADLNHAHQRPDDRRR